MVFVRLKNLKIIPALLFVFLLLAGCYGRVQQPLASSSLAETAAQDSSLQDNAIADRDREIEAAKSVFRANVKALNEENLDAYMATLDSGSSGFEQTRALIQNLFETYDLRYEIDAIEVVEASTETIKLRVTQSTKKISGPAFNNNQLVAIHTLRKRNGEWKISETEVKDVEAL